MVFFSILLIFTLSSTPVLANLVEDLLQLQDKLPQAICDKTFVSKPPYLKIPDTLSEQERMQQISYVYKIEDNLSYSDIFKLLMDSEDVFLGARGVLEERSKNPEIPLSLFKQKISHEFCVSLLSSEKLKEFMASKKNWLLELSQKSQNNKYFNVEDIENRFFKGENNILIGGWIDSSELISFTDQNGMRTQKILHPLTRQLQSLILMNKDHEPLGYYQLSSDVQSGFRGLASEENTKNEFGLRKRLEVYQLLIESEAYKKLFSSEDKKDKIKKIQEFYINLIQAFHIFPESPQFSTYKNKKTLKPQAEVDHYIQFVIQKNIQNIKIGDRTIEFHPFERDAKLFAIYSEFLSELKKI